LNPASNVSSSPAHCAEQRFSCSQGCLSDLSPYGASVQTKNEAPPGEGDSSPNTSNRLDVFDIVFQEALLDPEAIHLMSLDVGGAGMRIQREAFSTEDGMLVIDEEKVKSIVSELFASKEEWAERFRKEEDFCYDCRADVRLFTQLLADFAVRTFGTTDSKQWKPNVVKRWEPIEHLIAQTGYPRYHYNLLTGSKLAQAYSNGCDFWDCR